ncbi:hypothetical protein B0H14DRAFT_3524800 [Mycena olivaceomarginata]|nr:hypothetical protein B0H14DRAFT_3524800 [Mycena olivaceomarginata]
MSPGGADGAEGGKKEIAPKMIYGKAGAGKDAGRAQGARAVPDEGARTKKLPMEVVDAEYQWYVRFSFLTPRAMIAPVARPVHLDRRKLTLYFVAQGIPVDTTIGRHRDTTAGRVHIPWQK